MRNRNQAEDTETVARVRGALQGYLASGGGQDVSVSVRHVLDLLNPRGMWSVDPDQRGRAAPAEELPADGDPLTGCRPVTAPQRLA
jgi:hypothetical protein